MMISCKCSSKPTHAVFVHVQLAADVTPGLPQAQHLLSGLFGCLPRTRFRCVMPGPKVLEVLEAMLN